jgi:hypothetical protein
MTDTAIGPIDFGDAVARQLEDGGIPFVRDAAVHGYRPDFLLQCAPDRKVVLDVKNWKPDATQLLRAAEQAKRIKDVTDSDEAYVVMAEPIDLPLPKGVLTLDSLSAALAAAACDAGGRREPPAARPPAAALPAAPVKTIFAAMPFSGLYEDTFYVAITDAAERVGAAAKRVDLDPFEGDVVKRIQDLIRESAAVVADISEARPNVLYEVGFAHALGKPTVHICSTPLEELPFDVRNWNTLAYEPGRTHELRARLAERLRALL